MTAPEQTRTASPAPAASDALDAKGGESAFERVRELGGATEGVYFFLRAREGVYSFEILSMCALCATLSCITFTFMHCTCVRYYGCET